MTRNRILFALVLIVVAIAPSLTMAQNLAPIPTSSQAIYFLDKKHKMPLVAEDKANVWIYARLRDDRDGTYELMVSIENHSPTSLKIEAAKLFLLNANNRSLYRYSEQELRWGFYEAGRATVPPAQATQTYSIQPDGFGGYHVEADDKSLDQAVNDFTARMQQWQNRRQTKKAIENIERIYLTDQDLPWDKSSLSISFSTPSPLPRRSHYVS